jgi:hypothetical protein
MLLWWMLVLVVVVLLAMGANVQLQQVLLQLL